MPRSGGLVLSQLDQRQQARLEELLERASDRPGFFAEAREAAETDAKIAELARRAARRPFKRAEERGIFAELAEQLDGGYLLGEHAGLPAVIFACWQSGRAFAPRARVARDGGDPTLVLDREHGPFGAKLDPEGRLLRWRPMLQHLAANAWVEVREEGRELHIRPGVRARRALSGAKTKTEVQR